MQMVYLIICEVHYCLCNEELQPAVCFRIAMLFLRSFSLHDTAQHIHEKMSRVIPNDPCVRSLAQRTSTVLNFSILVNNFCLF